MRKVWGRVRFCMFYLLFPACLWAASVAVHDPSVVVVYKDSQGASYAENDASQSRTKFYYIFGTQLGAAYSRDLLDWTSFTPTFTASGKTSSDYLQVFADAASWSGHTTSSAVLGNLWAPDVIYNRSLGKWTMYYSVNGDDWHSSIVMMTADKIEGPYVYAGTVVYSGMDAKQGGVGLADYRKATGETNVASRYLDNSGNWAGTYGTSCIDPSVFYDEQGRLWLVYGSWSGGIFLLKLDEKTGLRNYTWNYGKGSAPVWDGTRLRYDPYMGVHVAGGYYVSGEGPYIRYLRSPSGDGYYYLFVSMGFYSPEGGYSMRVFRSSTVDGKYADVTGNDAVFDRYIFNYGASVTYGFPIMQNYRWSWWTLAEIAQGHNSALQESDGSAYLVYHRKMDNGTAWHNVETHQLHFNDQGWIVAAPFEYRVGYGLPATPYSLTDLVGDYRIIVHAPVDYAALASNQEKALDLHADGTLSGAYTGTWKYSYTDGRQYLLLSTPAGDFHGVVGTYLLNDHSAQTIAFSAMAPTSETALWGYKVPRTSRGRAYEYATGEKRVGAADYSLQWDAYDQFVAVDVSDSFETSFTFRQYGSGLQNWDNWALIFQHGSESWHLRGDAWSLSELSGVTVKHVSDWNGALDYKNAYNGKLVRLDVVRRGTTIDVFAYADSVLLYTATAINTPSGAYRILLGGEGCYLDMVSRRSASLETRERVGSVNDDGTYTAKFNSAAGKELAVGGDFHARFAFFNYRNPRSSDNWDNYIFKVRSAAGTMLLRADAYAMDAQGTMTYSYDWNWNDFLAIMAGAKVELDVSRTGSLISYNAKITARDGSVYHSKSTQTGASTDSLYLGFTMEESMVDLLSADLVQGDGTASMPVSSSSVGGGQSSSSSATTVLAEIARPVVSSGYTFVYDLHGRLRCVSQSSVCSQEPKSLVIETDRRGAIVRRYFIFDH